MGEAVSDINEACDIVYARMEAGVATSADRGVYELLSSSAFRLVPERGVLGGYTARDCDVMRAAQELVAEAVLTWERLGSRCSECQTPYRVTSNCERCESLSNSEP